MHLPNRVQEAQSCFVTRAKSTTQLRRIYPPPVARSSGVICNQSVALTGVISGKGYPEHLRRIRFKDPETRKTRVFLTHNFQLPAATLCARYQARGQGNSFPSGSNSLCVSRSSTTRQKMQ